MLLLAKKMNELDFGQLMQVYQGENQKTARKMHPDLPQGQGQLYAEQAFYQYLRECFFATAGAVCAIWEENGRYVSALRLEPYRDGLALTALETIPSARRQGFAKKLVEAVLNCNSGTKIYSHVKKANSASLALHESCGFFKILDYAVYLDGSVLQNCVTFCNKK